MCPLQLFKADGAEEEDGVKQQETEAQPAVQSPAVQMDTQNLSREGERKTSFNERQPSFPVVLLRAKNPIKVYSKLSDCDDRIKTM